MVIKINASVIGTANVQKFLKGKSKEVLNLAEKGIKEAGWHIQGEVVESISGHRAEPTSVDTGRFKSSVQTTFPKKLQSETSTNVKYAKGLEYGTSKMEARRHFGNTAKRNEKKVTKFIQDKVDNI